MSNLLFQYLDWPPIMLIQMMRKWASTTTLLSDPTSVSSLSSLAWLVRMLFRFHILCRNYSVCLRHHQHQHSPGFGQLLVVDTPHTFSGLACSFVIHRSQRYTIPNQIELKYSLMIKDCKEMFPSRSRVTSRLVSCPCPLALITVIHQKLFAGI